MADDSEWRKRIAVRLKELLELHGEGGRPLPLSKVETLTKGRISKSRLGNYTQGTRMPGPEEATILAEVFKVTPAHILCVEDMLALTPTEKQVVKDLRTLPENTRMEYVRHISVLASTYRDAVPDPPPTSPEPASTRRR